MFIWLFSSYLYGVSVENVNSGIVLYVLFLFRMQDKGLRKHMLFILWKKYALRQKLLIFECYVL